MRKMFLLICLFAAWGLQGCDDYLDIKPKGYTIPEYYDDYVLLMNGLPLYTTSDPLVNYLTDNTCLLYTSRCV